MDTLERSPDILTPEQAAGYLQVDRRTVYRYIREGRLIASRLGRVYRIPRHNLDLLLWSSRTRPDISLRDYTEAEVAEFLRLDHLDDTAKLVADRFTTATTSKAT